MSELFESKITTELPELIHFIEALIPGDTECGLPGIKSGEFFSFLEQDGELLHYLSEFRALITKIEIETKIEFAKVTVENFIQHPKFKKGLSKYLGIKLTDYYYQLPEVRRFYAQSVPSPFPKGNRVEAIDFSELESVYSRGKIYREV